MSFLRNLPVYPKLIWAMLKFVRDPRQLDNVIAISGDLNSPKELNILVEHFKKLPETRESLQLRPRLGNIDLAEMLELPEGTLGREYAEFMSRNGLSANDLDYDLGDGLHPWIMTHFYESHDIWHVVAGFDSDVAGELGLQAFYAAKGPSPFPLFILTLGLLNTVLFARDDKARRLDEIVRGWQLGKATKHLFGIDWKRHWQTPLRQIRQGLGFPEKFSTAPLAV